MLRRSAGRSAGGGGRIVDQAERGRRRVEEGLEEVRVFADRHRHRRQQRQAEGADGPVVGPDRLSEGFVGRPLVGAHHLLPAVTRSLRADLVAEEETFQLIGMLGRLEAGRRLQMRGGEGLVAAMPVVELEFQFLLERPGVEAAMGLERRLDQCRLDPVTDNVKETGAETGFADLPRHAFARVGPPRQIVVEVDDRNIVVLGHCRHSRWRGQLSQCAGRAPRRGMN